ncbi:hypothetical protein OWV82_002504 [Melia azedarach]|uniref:Uncharacterized protein n=1 Tax=Melia azedarach TaxID=155640 RepID=A0ACC1Z3D0_MELAZ|nr:hypothetical protein OWV82_002504 [Melia azedarach]
MRVALSAMNSFTLSSSCCFSASVSCTRFTAFCASSTGNIDESDVNVPLAVGSSIFDRSIVSAHRVPAAKEARKFNQYRRTRDRLFLTSIYQNQTTVTEHMSKLSTKTTNATQLCSLLSFGF